MTLVLSSLLQPAVAVFIFVQASFHYLSLQFQNIVFFIIGLCSQHLKLNYNQPTKIGALIHKLLGKTKIYSRFMGTRGFNINCHFLN